LKYQNVIPYIPNRFDEGYGLSDESLKGMLTILNEKNTTPQNALLITVDCGIVSHKQVDDAKKLGENLKKIRTKKNITQTELAKTLGVDKSFVSNIENGKTNPTLSTITNLAQTLGVSTNELLK
jgi:DNA-binding XRE family transcriptional regulator